MVSMAARSVSAHLKVLRVCGFCKIHRTNNPILKLIHEIFRFLSLTYTSAYVIQEAIYAYVVRNDMDRLARVMFLLLCHITSTAKQIVFHTRADDIETMIDDFDHPLYNQPEHKSLLKETSRNATRLVNAYYNIAFLTCTLWIVFPVIDHYSGKNTEFFFWKNNVDSNKPFVFEFFLMYSYGATSLIGIANTTMDAFMGTILYQSKTQFNILRINLERLPHKCWELKKYNNEGYEAILSREFSNCLEHYRRVCKTATDLEDIFGLAILVQFTIGGWILCMAAYKIVDLSVFSVEFASMFLFIFCILLELLLYCYYGNEARYESERIIDSVYAMDWLKTSVPFRKCLVILMERAKKPIKPAAGGVIPLTLDTYVTILKSSYTFYAVLRQTK